MNTLTGLTWYTELMADMVKTTKIAHRSAYILIGIILYSALPVLAQQHSQEFQNALTLYQNKQYKQAALQFSQINDPEAYLFAGKSFYSAAEYEKAKAYLSSLIHLNDDPVISQEAAYTEALCFFQLRQFAPALDLLSGLMNNAQSMDLQSQARTFYNEILGYLTLSQRRTAFAESTIHQVQLDLIQSVFSKVDKQTAYSLIHSLQQSEPPSADSTVIVQLKNKLDNFPDSNAGTSPDLQLKAPDGIAYQLGVALPDFTKDSNEYHVSQSLYYGIQMAVEKFNNDNPDQKVFIHFMNTMKNDTKPRDVMTEFAWNENVDMIIGPLYSEMAEKMAPMAEQYQIPLLAPLANTDSLNIDNPFVYQLNPTFSVRGRQMADFAVNSLHLDTLGVIVQRNSYGMEEAFAFRNEAEKLGAKIRYFFMNNFEAINFDVSRYTKYFNTNPSVADSLHTHPVQAVYLPFTGDTAPTLINLIMTDFLAYNSNFTILGSQEWAPGNVKLNPGVVRNFNIYYSGVNNPDESLAKVQNFKNDYKNRFGIEADKYSYIGYDCASYLLQTLKKVQNPALLKIALKNEPRYDGVGSIINFNGMHVNQGVEFYKITPQGTKKIDVPQ